VRIEPPKNDACWLHYVVGEEVQTAKLLQPLLPELVIETSDE
jgi:hypothetical protein